MARRGGAGEKAPVEWDFRTFPVLFAFALGAFISFWFTPFFPEVVFIVSLFSVSFGVAHMISTWFRRRAWAGTRKREDEEERERRAFESRAARARNEEATRPRRRRRRRE